MKRLLIVTMLIASCGNEDSQSTKEEDLKKEIAVETLSQMSPSLYLDKKTDMPGCAAENDRQLIYVAETKEFYYCSEQLLQWTAVDIKGKDGKDGVNGKDGLAGRDGEDGENGVDGLAGANGRDGANGQDGQDGRDGKDAPVIGKDMWVNPVTGHKWFISGLRTSTQTVDGEQCLPGSSAPTDEELTEAIGAGLTYGFRGSVAASYFVGIKDDFTNSDGESYPVPAVIYIQVSGLYSMTWIDHIANPGSLRALCLIK